MPARRGGARQEIRYAEPQPAECHWAGRCHRTLAAVVDAAAAAALQGPLRTGQRCSAAGERAVEDCGRGWARRHAVAQSAVALSFEGARAGPCQPGRGRATDWPCATPVGCLRRGREYSSLRQCGHHRDRRTCRLGGGTCYGHRSTAKVGHLPIARPHLHCYITRDRNLHEV
ncbi:hypothetical protein D3C79_488690 [compost metagenome]